MRIICHCNFSFSLDITLYSIAYYIWLYMPHCWLSFNWMLWRHTRWEHNIPTYYYIQFYILRIIWNYCISFDITSGVIMDRDVIDQSSKARYRQAVKQAIKPCQAPHAQPNGPPELPKSKKSKKNKKSKKSRSQQPWAPWAWGPMVAEICFFCFFCFFCFWSVPGGTPIKLD